MQELIVTGRSVDEAVAQACEQLGVSEDAFSYEVLELPVKKLFGQSPAKIKVTVSDDVFSVKKLLEQPEPEIKKPEHTHTEQRPARETTAPKAPPAPSVPDVEITEDELPESVRPTLAYFRSVVDTMGAKPFTYKFFKTETGVRFSLDGEDSALLIGRRGETMEALQYLCSLTNARGSKDFVKITLDVANYRSKREHSLEDTARRAAERVLRQHRSYTLPPMNPYERRIVHSEIQKIQGVQSESIGEEPNRRIVVSTEGYSRRPSNGAPRHGHSDRDRKPYPKKDYPPRQQTPSDGEQKPTREPSGDKDALYKKIEF